MKAAKLLACCLLVFPLVGTVSSTAPGSRTKLSSSKISPLRASFRPLQDQARTLYQSRHFIEAIPVCQKLHHDAAAAGLPGVAAQGARFTGACQFQLRRYRDALQSFLEARRLAENAHESTEIFACDLNIASLYSESGEVDAAAHWTQDLLQNLAPGNRQKYEAHLLVLLATLRARQNRMKEAEVLFAQGIAAADREGDTPFYANALNRLGEEYLKQHDLNAAEAPLLAAYRIRKLNHLPMDTSYRNLGLLRLEQGDLEAASVLLERALDLALLPQAVLPAWEGYWHRGRLRLAQGDLRAAMDDLRLAVRMAREWRWSAPPDDAGRVGAEGWLEKVHSLLVEAGNRLYLATGDPALLRETFEAAEENRASSLRALLAQRGETPAAKLPPAYWEALRRLQRAEIQALRSGSEQDQETVSAIRAELVRMEMVLGRGAAPLPPDLLERTRAALGPGTALFSFHLGESVSWLWALDREGLVLHRLPARAEVEAAATAAAQAIRTDAAGADEAAARLYRTLFGEVGLRFQRKTRWLIALDRGLFEAPFAALRTEGSYLAERHVLEIIPGAGAWVEAAARPSPMGSRFVGIGDAIYNTADPRLPQRAPASAMPILLPRLVASGREVESCARVWKGERVLLEGEAASRGNLLHELSRDPAVVHLATHVLQSGEQPVHGLIALSLNARRENELLPPQEIARWRTGARVIVMSGCHSAAGATLPGTGLLGLTRAWLAAGARSVIASNWATPDESGALFNALYTNLAGRDEFQPAAALRDAQLAMIRAGGWRARPHYWGAYFMVGTL